MGDMNAHFGLSCHVDYPLNFGKVLLHELTNENGQDVLQLCLDNDLLALTTIKHYSSRLTWHSGGRSSQIDHILKPRRATYQVDHLRAKWTKYPSDHKLITCTLRMFQNINLYERFKYPHLSIYRTQTWNFGFLTNPEIRASYEKLFNRCIYAEIEQDANLENSWELISKVACYCAENLLRVKTAYSEEQRHAFQEHKSLVRRVMRFREVDANQDANFLFY